MDELIVARKQIYSGDVNKARRTLLQALKASPESVIIKVDLILCEVFCQEFKKAEKLLESIQNIDLSVMNEETLFFVIFSKIRLLKSKKEINEGRNILTLWLNKFTSTFKKCLLVEEASLYILENNLSEGIRIINQVQFSSNEILIPQLRMFYLYVLNSLGQREKAYVISRYWSKESHSKYFFLMNIFTLINYKRELLSICIYSWLLIWCLTPISFLSQITFWVFIMFLILGFAFLGLFNAGRTIIYVSLLLLCTITIYYTKAITINLHTIFLIVVLFALVVNVRAFAINKYNA